MHPTQRKLMKRIILFLSLQFPITYPAIAGQDIDLVANVKNSTCKSGISNQGNIDLGVVGVGYFSDNVFIALHIYLNPSPKFSLLCPVINISFLPSLILLIS